MTENDERGSGSRAPGSGEASATQAFAPVESTGSRSRASTGRLPQPAHGSAAGAGIDAAGGERRPNLP
ncbi:MAG: hypothetical protein M3445_09840, partial [Actinomycetota bacterium]|nr:hypothetical protein [Actinomycetota bacterium]